MDKNNSLVVNARLGGVAFSAMIILYLVITVIGQSIILLIGDVMSVAAIAISSTFSSLAIIFALASVSFKTGAKIKDTCGIKKFNPVYILLSLLFSFSMFFGLGFVNSGISSILEKIGLNQSSIYFPLENSFHLILFSFTFALLPAIFEELFFRGVIFGSVRNGGIIFSALFSSLFFALYHCSLVQFFYQFIYGVGLCLIKDISKSVIPAMVSHFINNFAVILLQYFKVNIDLNNAIVIALGIIGLIAFSVICYIKLRKTAEEKNKGAVQEFLLPYGLVGGCACLALLILGLF